MKSFQSAQDPKIISIFEIIAAYFCDTIFNHIFHSAKTNVSNGASLTDEYIKRVHAYVIGVKTDRKCYGEIVKGVHNYFIGTTRFTTLSFADFVDRIIGVCVPPEYFSQFSPQDKDELLSSVLCDLVSNLTAFSTKPDMLRRIIDNHTSTPEVTIRMLQDAAVHTLTTKRIALHNKFLHKVGQARDTVPMDVIDDMKKVLRRLVKEKTEAMALADAAKLSASSAVAELRKVTSDFKVREAKLLQLIEMLKAQRLEDKYKSGVNMIIPPKEVIAEPRHQVAQRVEIPRREVIAESTIENEQLSDENSEENENSDDNDITSAFASNDEVPNNFFTQINAEPIIETPVPVRRKRPAFYDNMVEKTGNPELDDLLD